MYHERNWREKLMKGMKGTTFWKKTLAFLLCFALFLGVGFKVEAATKKHNVLFIYGTNMVQVQVRDGKDAVAPTNTYVPGYTFIGWNADITHVKSDMVVLGMYIPGELPVWNSMTAVTGTASTGMSVPQTTATYKVVFYNGNTKDVLKTEYVPYGGNATPPVNPCYGGYDFGYWVGEYNNVTSDREIMAVYYRTHTVEFKNEVTGERIDLQYIRDGETAREPKPDEMDGYEFIGWSRSLENIKEDNTVIYAQYKKR